MDICLGKRKKGWIHPDRGVQIETHDYDDSLSITELPESFYGADIAEVLPAAENTITETESLKTQAVSETVTAPEKPEMSSGTKGIIIAAASVVVLIAAAIIIITLRKRTKEEK